MVWLKSCPKCSVGDLHLASDIYGKYIQCLQCGHLRELPATESSYSKKVAPVVVKEKREPIAA